MWSQLSRPTAEVAWLAQRGLADCANTSVSAPQSPSPTSTLRCSLRTVSLQLLWCADHQLTKGSAGGHTFMLCFYLTYGILRFLIRYKGISILSYNLSSMIYMFIIIIFCYYMCYVSDYTPCMLPAGMLPVFWGGIVLVAEALLPIDWLGRSPK